MGSGRTESCVTFFFSHRYSTYTLHRVFISFFLDGCWLSAGGFRVKTRKVLLTGRRNRPKWLVIAEQGRVRIVNFYIYIYICCGSGALYFSVSPGKVVIANNHFFVGVPFFFVRAITLNLPPACVCVGFVILSLSVCANVVRLLQDFL